MKRVILALLSIIISTNIIFAQGIDDISITSTGIADTEQEAILNALRSAIEQVYGSFVSSNTSILNDELVKDEIVSVTKGNIKSYEKLAITVLTTGQIMATVKTVVSVSKLISYAKSKGSSAEYDGQTFALNMKLMKLRRSNTETVLDHTFEQIYYLLDDAFDYEIALKEPILARKTNDYADPVDGYSIEATIKVLANDTARSIYSLLYETLSAISLSQEELDSAKGLGVWVQERKIRDGRNRDKILYFYSSIDDRINDLHKRLFSAAFSYTINLEGVDVYRWRSITEFKGVEIPYFTYIYEGSVKLPRFLSLNNLPPFSYSYRDNKGMRILCSETETISATTLDNLYHGIWLSNLDTDDSRYREKRNKSKLNLLDWRIILGNKNEIWDHPSFVVFSGSLRGVEDFLKSRGHKNLFWADDVEKAFDALSSKDKRSLAKKVIPKSIFRSYTIDHKEISGAVFISYLPLQKTDNCLFSYPIDLFVSEEQMASFSGVRIVKE